MNEVIASTGIYQVPELGDVYFISSELVFEYKNSEKPADDYSDGCWWNIFDYRAGNTNLYDKSINEFINGNSSVQNVSAIHKSLARRGFCVTMPMCDYAEERFSTSKSYKAVFFQLGTYEKLYSKNASKFEWKDTPVLALPNLYEAACKSNVEGKRWLVSTADADSEPAYYECVDAGISRKSYIKGETTDQKRVRIEKICKKFICKTEDVFNELKNQAPYNTSGYCDDIEEEPDKACLEAGTECKGCGFREPSDPKFLNGCVWDQDPETKSDSCGDKNVIREKDGYKYFCSVLNKIIRCRETGVIKFNDYKNVFGFNNAFDKFTENLINPTQCTDIYSTPVCGDECKLENTGGDPLSCCFGTGSKTCAASNKVVASLAGGGKYLYCSSDNKVINCPAGVNPSTGSSTIKKYYNPAPLPGELPGVFRNNQFKSTELNLSANCNITDSPTSPVDNPEQVMGDCKIDQDSASCTYGGLASSENCWKKNFYIKNGGFNLFCNGLNQTIRCKEEIKDYAAAFPGAAPDSATWTPANDCVPYIPGMDNEIEEEVEQCGLVEEGNIFYVGPGKEMDEGDNLFRSGTFDAKKRELAKCVAGGKAEEKCYEEVFGAGTAKAENFYVCECSTQYNPTYDPLGCTLNPFPDDKNCTERCVLVKTSFSEFSTLRTQVAVSPLGLIRSISDFLFAAAVLIFIINMLRASFMYVTSGGDESKMKEAQSTITNTIFGMIFIVFIGALIRWVTSVTTGVVTP